MAGKLAALAGVLLACFASPLTSAQAPSASDPVNAVLNAVPTPPVAFVGITPCRLVDTRGNGFTGSFGPPALVGQPPGGTFRFFPVAGNCGIPATARALSANFAVTNTTGNGFISVWPGDGAQPVPLVASMNFSTGQTIANAVLVPLGSGGINVFARVATDLIVDVNGYFDTGSEGWHEIGANIGGCSADDKFCGDPDCPWHNLTPPFSSAGYYRDPTGVVHLKGVVSRAGGTGFCFAEVFVLPQGYRPAKGSIFATVSDDVHATVYVSASTFPGAVRHQIGGDPMAWLALDGISFRCAPSGVDGCP